MPELHNRTLEQLRKGISGLSNEKLKEALTTLLQDVETGLEEAKRRISAWFDGAMDRVSGWYKRRTQWVLFALAVTMAALLNADAIVITQTLLHDSRLREAVASAAEVVADGAVAQGKDDSAVALLQSADRELQGLTLPLGWIRGDGEGDPRTTPNGSMPGWL